MYKKRNPTELSFFSREMKTYVHTKTWALIFIAAFFVIAKNWKQSRCPSTGEWLRCGASMPQDDTQQ